MDWMAKMCNTTVRHTGNGAEMQIDSYKVNGVDLQNGSILEFQGCFLDGCDAHYPNRATDNPMNGITMEDLHERMRRKTEALRAKGYTMFEKWECQFRKDIKENAELQEFYATYEPYQALKPEDAFYGGRTNAIPLYYVPKEEVLRYVDFTSLYPYICKNGMFPRKHPEIYFGEDIPYRVQGLMKCKVLTLAKLFHPVLPH